VANLLAGSLDSSSHPRGSKSPRGAVTPISGSRELTARAEFCDLVVTFLHEKGERQLKHGK